MKCPDRSSRATICPDARTGPGKRLGTLGFSGDVAILPQRCPRLNLLSTHALIRTCGRGQATTARTAPRKREYRRDFPPRAWRQEKRTSMAGRLACFVTLRTLLPAIKRSPIVVAGGRMLGWSSQFSVCEWARIRNSPEVDAFVLAWIAGHANEQSRRRRLFM
jgi:hypothetical protein